MLPSRFFVTAYSMSLFGSRSRLASGFRAYFLTLVQADAVVPSAVSVQCRLKGGSGGGDAAVMLQAVTGTPATEKWCFSTRTLLSNLRRSEDDLAIEVTSR